MLFGSCVSSLLSQEYEYWSTTSMVRSPKEKKTRLNCREAILLVLQMHHKISDQADLSACVKIECMASFTFFCFYEKRGNTRKGKKGAKKCIQLAAAKCLLRQKHIDFSFIGGGVVYIFPTACTMCL